MIGSGFFFQSGGFFFRVKLLLKVRILVQRIAEQDLDIKNDAILQQTKELGFAITYIPAFLQDTVCQNLKKVQCLTQRLDQRFLIFCSNEADCPIDQAFFKKIFCVFF